jgi:hypothetical protein
MPMAGLGMGNIGTYGNNTFDAVNTTAAFLRLGGRRTDAADSYGDEPGIGLAMREFLAKTKVSRTEVFIESKTGPGGLAWPLGYNETIAQAIGIVANYSGGSALITSVDLILVHWPVNYGPCQYSGPPDTSSIPTTDAVRCKHNSRDEIGARWNVAGLRPGAAAILGQGVSHLHLEGTGRGLEARAHACDRYRHQHLYMPTKQKRAACAQSASKRLWRTALLCVHHSQV